MRDQLIAFALLVVGTPLAAGVYHVAPTGTAAGAGTQSAPWSLARAGQAAMAGDTVIVHAGVYREPLVVRNSGTASAPIIFSAASGEAMPVLDGTGLNGAPSGSWSQNLTGMILVQGQRWVQVRGLRVQNSPWAGIQAFGSSEILIEGCSTYNTRYSGVSVMGASGALVQGIKVIRNRIEQANTSAAQGIFVNEGLTVSDADGFEVAHNLVDGSLAEALDVKGASRNGSIHHNETRASKMGLYVDAWDKESYAIDVHSNRVHGNGSGLVLSAETGGSLKRIRVYNNLVYNNAQGPGLIVSDYVAGYSHAMDSIEIYHNTIVGNGKAWWGGGIALLNPEARNVSVRNNIVAGNVDAPIAVVKAGPGLVIDNNLLWGEAKLNAVSGTNALLADPRFINAAAGDFRLQAGSPAIDRAWGAFVPPFDFAGVARPQGPAPDLGAHEAIPAATPVPTPTAVATATQAPTAVATPTAAPTAVPARGNGLCALWWANESLAGAACLGGALGQVDFAWAAGGPASCGGLRDQFSARIEGELEAPVSGDYTVHVTADDGIRLWVDGALRVDRWVHQAATESSVALPGLRAGQRVALRLEYFEYAGDAALHLRWSGPGMAKQVVPQGRLYSAACSSGAGTATPPPATLVPTALATPTAVAGGKLQLQHRSSDPARWVNSPHEHIRVYNTGSAATDLLGLELSYWFHGDGGSAFQAWVDWSSAAGVLADVQALPLGGQTHRLRARFTRSVMLAPGAFVEVQLRYNRSDWANVDQYNDHSFRGEAAFSPWTRVTAESAGLLLWGVLPASAPSPGAIQSAGTKDGTGLRIDGGALPLPAGRRLLAAPNPSRGTVRARFNLESPARARLVLADLHAPLLFIDLGELAAGGHERDLDLTRFASGIYVLRLQVQQAQRWTGVADFKLALVR